MTEIIEEPPGVPTILVDKLPKCHYPASTGALFFASSRAGQIQKSAVILSGLHHSGCFRPAYLLVGDGVT